MQIDANWDEFQLQEGEFWIYLDGIFFNTSAWRTFTTDHRYRFIGLFVSSPSTLVCKEVWAMLYPSRDGCTSLWISCRGGPVVWPGDAFDEFVYIRTNEASRSRSERITSTWTVKLWHTGQLHFVGRARNEVHKGSNIRMPVVRVDVIKMDCFLHSH